MSGYDNIMVINMKNTKSKTFYKLFELMGLIFALIYLIKSLIEDFATM